MSLAIYLDDCAYAKLLVTLLQAAGHRVVTPAEAETTGMDDEAHLDYAFSQGLALVTRDADDFAALHEAGRKHAGILAICKDNDPHRDMTYADILLAIRNLEAAGLPITGAYHVLNAWRY